MGADQEEAHRDRQGEEHDQREGHPVRVGEREDGVPGRDQHAVPAEDRHRQGGQTQVCLGSAHRPRDRDARDGDHQIDVGEGVGAVRMEQKGARGHHQERDREPEGDRLGAQQDQSSAHQSGGLSRGSRRRRTSSVITPIAISGWLSTASWNASRRSRNAST